MGITVAMAALAFLSFIVMLGAKSETICINSARVCIGAMIAMVLSALIR